MKKVIETPEQGIDFEHSVIQRTLPNGDIVNIRPMELIEKRLNELPKLRTTFPGIEGALQCPHCGVGYLSAAALRDHIRNDHAIASGQAENEEVELPDGTVVPLELIMREWLQQKAVEYTTSAAGKATARAKDTLKE